MPQMMGPDGQVINLPYGDEGGGDPMGMGAEQMSAVDHLRTAIEHAQMAMQQEPDDMISKELSKAVQVLYGITSLLQKEKESAMGVTPAHKAMSRGY